MKRSVLDSELSEERLKYGRFVDRPRYVGGAPRAGQGSLGRRKDVRKHFEKDLDELDCHVTV